MFLLAGVNASVSLEVAAGGEGLLASRAEVQPVRGRRARHVWGGVWGGIQVGVRTWPVGDMHEFI